MQGVSIDDFENASVLEAADSFFLRWFFASCSFCRGLAWLLGELSRLVGKAQSRRWPQRGQFFSHCLPCSLPTTPESLLVFETNSGFIDLQAWSPLYVWMVSVHFGLLLCPFSWTTEREEYLKLCVFTQQRRSLESRGLEGSAPMVFSSLFLFLLVIAGILGFRQLSLNFHLYSYH